MTEEELELLKTKPRNLTVEDQRRQNALKKRIRRGGRSPGTKARDNEKMRKRRAERSPDTRARDNEKKRKRRVERVAGLSPQARSAELKSKAEREALQRAGMSRREHEQVMQ